MCGAQVPQREAKSGGAKEVFRFGKRPGARITAGAVRGCSVREVKEEGTQGIRETGKIETGLGKRKSVDAEAESWCMMGGRRHSKRSIGRRENAFSGE